MGHNPKQTNIMQTTVIETKTTWAKNPNTKTTYIKESEEITELTKEQHHNTTNREICTWFRRLGGSETAIMGYTSAGYLCTKLTSTSPDKLTKITRTFKFITA